MRRHPRHLQRPRNRYPHLLSHLFFVQSLYQPCSGRPGPVPSTNHSLCRQITKAMKQRRAQRTDYWAVWPCFAAGFREWSLPCLVFRLVSHAASGHLVLKLTSCRRSPTQIQTSKSSSPRPTTPRPPSRPPMMTSHSDSVIIEHAPPVIPPRHTKPPDLSQPPPEDISTEPGIVTLDASPRAGKVAATLGRFA